MKPITFLAFTIAISLCFNCSQKSKYKSTTRLNDHLFIETYRAGSIGNLNADYLTDSTNFRLYTGTFDDETERLYYKVSGDSVFVQKIVPKKGFVPGTQTEITSEKHYNLKDLQSTHKFE